VTQFSTYYGHTIPSHIPFSFFFSLAACSDCKYLSVQSCVTPRIPTAESFKALINALESPRSIVWLTATSPCASWWVSSACLLEWSIQGCISSCHNSADLSLAFCVFKPSNNYFTLIWTIYKSVRRHYLTHRVMYVYLFVHYHHITFIMYVYYSRITAVSRIGCASLKDLLFYFQTPFFSQVKCYKPHCLLILY
jgi:hypothetical protein